MNTTLKGDSFEWSVEPTPWSNIPNYPDIEKLKSDLSQLKNVIMLAIGRQAQR